MAITELIPAIDGTVTSPIESVKVMISRREILVRRKMIYSVVAKIRSTVAKETRSHRRATVHHHPSPTKPSSAHATHSMPTSHTTHTMPTTHTTVPPAHSIRSGRLKWNR